VRHTGADRRRAKLRDGVLHGGIHARCGNKERHDRQAAPGGLSKMLKKDAQKPPGSPEISRL